MLIPEFRSLAEEENEGKWRYRLYSPFKMSQHVEFLEKQVIFPKPKRKKLRGHPGLNRGPLDLQSNALPLSYIPT